MRILALVLMLATSALALDLHPDYRFSYFQCWTWGSGHYSEARSWLRLKEGWNTSTSLYPVDWQASSVCQYKGDPMPMAKPGEYLVQGNLCAPKTVIPKVCMKGPNDKMRCHVPADCPMGECVPGLEQATSWPLAYIWVSVDYNGGGQSFPSGCKWDDWAYGAPPVTTTTTTLMP